MPGTDASPSARSPGTSPASSRERPAPGERMGDGPSDGGRIRLEDLDVNPYPSYRALRDEGVVWVEAIQRWLVTRWDDVIAVETDRVSYSAMERDSLQTRVMGRTMLRSDGDAHKRLRRAAQDPLRPATVEQQWRPLFQSFADEIIDGFAAARRRGAHDRVRGPAGGALPGRGARAARGERRRAAVLVAGAHGRHEQLRRRPGHMGAQRAGLRSRSTRTSTRRSIARASSPTRRSSAPWRRPTATARRSRGTRSGRTSSCSSAAGSTSHATAPASRCGGSSATPINSSGRSPSPSCGRSSPRRRCAGSRRWRCSPVRSWPR